MSNLAQIEVNPENLWRLETPGCDGWKFSAHPGAANKYFIVSCDAHIGPPPSLFRERIEPQYKDRLPRMERDEKGVLWAIMEGSRPAPISEAPLGGEDHYRTKSGGAGYLEDQSAVLDKRIADLNEDGVDAELLFPNAAAILAFWTPDPAFSQAQFRIYNDWIIQLTAPYSQRMNPAACVATADIDSAIVEIERVAKLGFRLLTLPCKPIFGPNNAADPNYNLPLYDRLWAAIQDHDLPITFHVSTGTDPRASRGNGGAVVNYVVHSMSPTAEPVANLCASGVLDRFPKLRFGTIEAGAGWVPWFLKSMDEGYKKHHMWVRPKLKNGLPSDYYRAHAVASFADDPVAMELVERHGLENNFVWGNDYPHHEGTFPHSMQAIERTMGHLKEDTRAKVLGLNAARVFRFEIPERYRQQYGL
jgi:predicted TIM-barrel fold metal-dependent hydrolase